VAGSLQNHPNTALWKSGREGFLNDSTIAGGMGGGREFLKTKCGGG